MLKTTVHVLAAALLLAAARGGYAQMSAANPTGPAEKAVPKYGVFEVSLTSDQVPQDPFWGVKVWASFTSPSAGQVRVDGFYYGGNEWRVRFVPREHGRWSYQAVLSIAGREVEKAGSFECKGTDGHGFLRISPRNRYRLEYEDGTPFYPIGVQSGEFTRVGFDGPWRDEGHRGQAIPMEQWCKEFQGATNLVRWQMIPGGPPGHALALVGNGGPLNQYDQNVAAKMDDLYRLQKKHGFSHILIPFEDMSLWGSRGTPFGNARDLKEYKSLQAKNLPFQEQYLHYLVARYACWVDIWEIFNEDSYAPDDYLAHLAKVIRQADPYAHPVTTNYARPQQDWCEIVTWHEYMGMEPNQVDAHLTKEIGALKSYGKPVLNTEFGNQGWRSNYDPIKWRIAVWTAFMNESNVLFWNSSSAKSRGRRPYRGNANAYLGPESRQAFRVLNEFTRDLPIDMRPAASGYTEHNDIRTYALSNGKVTALYVHHFADHQKAYQHPEPLFVQTGPGRFRARWIDPADGKEVATDELSTEQQYVSIKLPPVTIDLACRIERSDKSN